MCRKEFLKNKFVKPVNLIILKNIRLFVKVDTETLFVRGFLFSIANTGSYSNTFHCWVLEGFSLLFNMYL